MTSDAGNNDDRITSVFIYKTQRNRKINPIFMIFTLQGIVWMLAAYVVFFEWGGGFLWSLSMALLARKIYRDYFPYRTYELERIYLVDRTIKALHDRKFFLRHRHELPSR